MPGFLNELRRRNVFKVAAAYTVVAWLLVQVIVSIKNPLHLPVWSDTLIIVLLITGFPIACLLAWAYEITPEGIQSDSSTKTLDGSRRINDRLLNFLIIGSICTAVIFLVIVRSSPDTSKSAPAIQPMAPAKPAVVERPSVVVLPFDNLSDDASQEYFADGLTDDLITDLAKLSGLFVIARNSAFTYKNRKVRADQIASELGVQYIISGSVRRNKDSVRVNAQLVEGTSGRDVWSERYNRKLTDIFAVQDDLVKRIVAALSVQLTQSEQTRMEQRRNPEFKAYDLYLQAQNAFHSQDFKRLQGSLELYRQSWQEDPGFARAYAGYARVVMDIWLGNYLELMVNPVAMKEAKNMAAKALSLDPQLADAHAAKALLFIADADYSSALESAKRAVELDPNSLDARIVLALVSGYAGLLPEALDAMQAAERFDPMHSTYVSTYYGWALYLNQDFKQAATVLEPLYRDHYEDTQYTISENAPAVLLAAVYAELGRLKDARKLAKKLIAQFPYLSLAGSRASFGLYARKEDIEYRLSGLRKAGIPEWPFGFNGAGMERLGHSDIAELIDNRTWEGYDRTRTQKFNAVINHDGSIHFLAANTSMSGVMHVKGDELCESLNIVYWGRDLCGPVYRNPDGSFGSRDEFILVNAASVWRFSLLNQ